MVAPREIWWAEVEGAERDKVWLCVVVRVASDFVEVVYGQGSPGKDADAIEVIPGTLDGDRYFQVTKPTYFRSTNVALLRGARLKRRVGFCTRDLFGAFCALAERFNTKAGE